MLGEVLTTPPREKQTVMKYSQARCFLWRQNNTEVKHSLTGIWGGVFIEGASCNRKRKSDILLSTWNRPLGRTRRRWEDIIKMDLQEVGRGWGDWMELAQDRDRWRALVSTVMNFGVVP